MIETNNEQSHFDDLDDKGNKVERKTSINNSLVKFYKLYWKVILTELVSTSILLLLGCMSCVPIQGSALQSPLYGSLGFGLTVLVNVHTFGHISGAHMNPAVTLTAVLKRITPVRLGIAYVIAQCIGAVLGFGILVAVSPIDLKPGGVCATVPRANQHDFQTLLIEIALTTVLGLVCCSAWDPVNKHNQDSMSLKFGFIIAALSIAGGPFTGASMNPARTLAPAIWTGTWTAHWAYWIGPLIGSLLAVLIYWVITPSNSKTNCEK